MELIDIKKALGNELFPSVQNKGNSKLASVLVLIYGHKPKVLMTEKPLHLKIHAGEIAFPGGKWSETDDSDLLETAIRETNEEIGLPISRNDVICQLESVRTLNSGFTITPFVSILSDMPILKPNSEVEEILHIPLIPFLQSLEDDSNPEHQSIQEMHTFKFSNKVVWGASARILKQIANLLEISD